MTYTAGWRTASANTISNIQIPYSNLAYYRTKLPWVQTYSGGESSFPGESYGAYYSAQTSFTGAWNSGCYDSRRNRLILFGGGDGDYFGNELIGLNVGDLTTLPSFYPITSPSGWEYSQIRGLVDGFASSHAWSPARGTEELLPDHTPSSRHTYGGMCYITHADRVMIVSGSGPSAPFLGWTWTFDCAENEAAPTVAPYGWHHMATTYNPNATAMYFSLGYDPVSKLVFTKGVKWNSMQCFLAYSYDQQTYNGVTYPANTWTEAANLTLAFTGNQNAVIDPVRRKYVLCGGSHVHIIDLNTFAEVSLNNIGEFPGTTNRPPSLCYHPGTGLIIAWEGCASSVTSTKVYTLDISNGVDAVWTAYTLAGAPTPAGNGGYGRMQFIPSLNGFIVANSTVATAKFLQLPESMAHVPLPANTWVKRSYNKTYAIGDGGKHVHSIHRQVDGRIWMACGDHQPTIGVVSPRPGDSGGNEVYAYSLRTDEWEEAWPYSHTDTRPSHPDQSPFFYDSTQDRFWLLSGQDWDPAQSGLCPSPAGEVRGQGWTFDPTLKKWTLLTPTLRPGLVSYLSPNKDFVAFDPRTNALITLWRNPGGNNEPVAALYHIATDTRTNVSFGSLGALPSNIFNAVSTSSAIDVPGRVIWTLNTRDGTLMKYHIDNRTLVDASPLPAAVSPLDQEMLLFWNSNSNVVHYCSRRTDLSGSSSIFNLFTYNPSFGTWEQDVMLQPEGETVRGRLIAYDPYQDILVTFGGSTTMYMYRYASGVTPPISFVQASGITATAATITWITSEARDSQVAYGLTSAYGSLQPAVADPAMVTSHSVALSGLIAGTTYHYQAMSRNVGGDLSVSGDYVFTTTALPDTTPPVISAVTASAVTQTTATVTWNTNESSDSQAEYGLTTAYGLSTALLTTMVTAHTRPLSGLTAGATYHYRVKSRDASGNLGVSGDYVLTTLPLANQPPMAPTGLRIVT